MAVASRLAVARVSPDGAAGRRGRPGFAVVGIPAAAQRGRRRGGAVAASPPTEEAVQMTKPLTKEDLVAYLVSGCKPKENWRIGTEHEKFGFEVETLHPIKYDQIRDILNGLSERFEWEKIIEENNVIGLKQQRTLPWQFLRESCAQGFAFASSIMLHIPNADVISLTGDERADRKSSQDSAALLML